ncbi:MAG: pseudouridine synthase [Treponema sp.]|nr:MAG: pseudouridine synthase [Treponema sp.]
MLNKPAGFVCSFVSDRHPVVYELVSSVVVSENLGKLHSVGRLDCDTSGLLLYNKRKFFA